LLSVVRRLFFTFASGPPGIGLLLLRLLAGGTIVGHNVAVLQDGVAAGAAVFASVLIALGILIIVGLWTPIAGALIAASALYDGFTHHPDRIAISVGVLGVALALLGPGAWSVDARLFGWKRL
jgi:putative oxidoreductase